MLCHEFLLIHKAESGRVIWGKEALGIDCKVKEQGCNSVQR